MCFSPQAILSRLDRRLDLLVDGPQGVPPQHQTLSAAIGCSQYNKPNDDIPDPDFPTRSPKAGRWRVISCTPGSRNSRPAGEHQSKHAIVRSFDSHSYRCVWHSRLDLDNLEVTTGDEIDAHLTRARKERGALDPGPLYAMTSTALPVMVLRDGQRHACTPSEYAWRKDMISGTFSTTSGSKSKSRPRFERSSTNR
jgi:hypothetical protein